MYLETSIRIGDLIFEEYLHKKRSEKFDHDIQSLSIYKGTSGLILYYLDLYNCTENSKYLSKLELLGNDLMTNLRAVKKVTVFALYLGSLGISEVLIRLYKLFGNKKYLDQAIQLIRAANPEMSNQNISDILAGQAGTILSLVRIHNILKEDWIIPKIESWLHLLMQKIKLSKSGVFWDLNYQYKSGLCGFAHGSSGVAFTMLELGHYFGNDAFYWLAELAFAHEDGFYDKKSNNWYDLRTSPDEEKEYEEKFKKEKEISFPQNTNMVAWCNCATGIGFATLRAIQLSKNPKRIATFQNAIDKTFESTSRFTDLSLCHGIAGNALLYWESYLLTGNKEHYTISSGFANQVTKLTEAHLKKTKKLGPDDQSLLLGLAGVGHFLLRKKFANKLDHSVLFPIVSTKNDKETLLSRLSKSDILSMAYHTLFPNTSRFFQLPEKSLDQLENVHELRNTLKYEINKKENWLLSNLADYENTLQSLLLDNTNNFGRYIRSKVLNTQIKSTIDNIEKIELVLSPDVHILKTKGDWHNRNIQFPKEEKDHIVLCRVDFNGEIQEWILNDVTGFIFESFSEKKTYADGLKIFLKQFDIKLEEMKGVIEMYHSQIISAIESLILINSEYAGAIKNQEKKLPL